MYYHTDNEREVEVKSPIDRSTYPPSNSFISAFDNILSLLEPLPIVVVVADTAGDVMYANSKTEELTARDRRYLLGTSMWQYVASDEPNHRRTKAYFVKNKHWKGYRLIHLPDGQTKRLQLDTHRLQLDSSEEPLIAIYMTDDALFCAKPVLADQFKESVFVVDRDSRLLHYNDQFAKVIKQETDTEAYIGLNLENNLPVAYRGVWSRFHQRLLEGYTSSGEQNLLSGSNQSQLKATLVYDKAGKLASICYTSSPAESQTASKEGMAYQQGILDERERTSMELHDGVGQLVSACQMRLNIVSPENCNQQLLRIREQMGAIQKEVRRVSQSLTPLAVEKYGIVKALSLLLEDAKNNNGEKLSVATYFRRESFASSFEVGLYRIVQEILHNDTTHNKSKHASITIIEEEDIMNVSYRNNVSFANPQINKGGFGQGLANIRKRVGSFGGKIEIEKGNNSGFLININLPII